ncbi:hypothetical protein CCP4SC76_2940002 [Gammaproteobacteria bacterium]
MFWRGLEGMGELRLEVLMRRCAAAKSLEECAVCLTVEAHVRHVETNYDELFMEGYDKVEARRRVSGDISSVTCRWRWGESRLFDSGVISRFFFPHGSCHIRWNDNWQIPVISCQET